MKVVFHINCDRKPLTYTVDWTDLPLPKRENSVLLSITALPFTVENLGFSFPDSVVHIYFMPSPHTMECLAEIGFK